MIDLRLQYFSFLGSEKCFIVFDGYLEESPKDHEHRFRRKHSCSDLFVRPEKKIPASREKFLTNSQNKEQLIEMLMEALTKVGEQVLKSNKDADTLVVQTAVTQTDGGNKSVQVLANDSDILFLLVYYGHQFQNLRSGDVLIHQVWDVMTEAQRQWFLLAYAYSRRDTVSYIFGKGTVTIMKMFTDPKNGEILAPILEAFMNPDTPLEVILIDRECVRLMQLIYGDISKSLGELRCIAYRKKLQTGR